VTRDDIIRMAREAGMEWPVWGASEGDITRFAALVAEHEREHGIKLLLDVLIDAAVKAEREACADIAENWRCNGAPRVGVAAAIRARGKE